MKSFVHAFQGLCFLLRSQRNARVHAFFTIAALVVSLVLRIDRHDWCWMIVAIAMVWAAEAFNTAVERLADRVTTERDELIKQAKDLAAGAVLCAALGAALIGFLVLVPPLLTWLGWRC